MFSFFLTVVFAFALFDKGEPAKVDVNTLETLPYTTFLNDIKNKHVQNIYYESHDPNVYIEKVDGNYYITTNPEYDAFKKDMLEQGLSVCDIDTLFPPEKSPSGWMIILFIIACMVVLSLALRWILAVVVDKAKSSQIEEVVVNGKPNPHIKEVEKKENGAKTFKDIAGLYEVKKDVQCLVDFLKNKEKYTQAGATLPKGVIFYGPPGTGKTLLAKAIAGEVGIPFHYMSGSDFMEMYVGMGAKRVRELFETARKKTPCIVFIDEIDAIGSRRSKDDHSGEDRKTLNALLTEMDGFKPSENILVIAATNRIEDLDSALLRAGRFTNKFCVPLPETAKERLEIIKLYAKNKCFAEDVCFTRLSKETSGFSPATIEALLNEAAIISVQDKKRFIDKVSIDKAMFKLIMSGHVKENQAERNPTELELVAWHEAGHALVGKLNGKEIPKVTILSTTSGAGGVTFTMPRDINLYSIKELKMEVMELYAGRVAELMLYKDKEAVTTGASNDIQKATEIIKEIVTSYGMSEDFGLLNLNQLNVGQNIIVEKEIALAKAIEQDTIKLLEDNLDTLSKIANALLEAETLYDNDITAIINEEKVYA